MDEEQTTEETPEAPAENKDAGDKPEESKAVAKLRKDNERLEKQLAKKKELMEEQMELEARESLGGKSEAGVTPPKPTRLTDTEYAEALERGEVNPLEEDGLI